MKMSQSIEMEIAEFAKTNSVLKVGCESASARIIRIVTEVIKVENYRPRCAFFKIAESRDYLWFPNNWTNQILDNWNMIKEKCDKASAHEQIRFDDEL